jgi:thiol-disulfide isomerase/thioredoxin
MKNIFLMFILIPILLHSQEASIHFQLKNSQEQKIAIINHNYSNPEVIFGKDEFSLTLFEGKTTLSFNLEHPIFVEMEYRSDSTKDFSSYMFYLSPGDKLNFSVDLKKPKQSIKVSGKGSENNQALIQEITNNPLSLKHFKKDSLPYDVFKAIHIQQKKYKKNLDQYILKYQPSNSFIKVHTLFVDYFLMEKYISFKGSQKFSIRDSYFRHENKWQVIEDSLINIKPICDEELLNLPSFIYFVPLYVTRLKERIWHHPDLLKDYFLDEMATQIMQLDPQNLLQEKIIAKHFTGKCEEYLYAYLFKEAFGEKEDNLPEIFQNFKEKFPESKYIPYLEKEIANILNRRKRSLTEDMILIENSDSIQTIEDLIHLVKGKTVLLDMWGTWCGPCRSEINLNSDSIKIHFKDKALDFLYVANYDLNNVNKWKELIAYYNLTGTHILANTDLTKNIMEKVNSNGYPTYIIIKKDGTFELSKAGYPMNLETLFIQLETALNH